MRAIDLGKCLALGGVAAVMVTGCAVLTIDVDVYKGSMANHEDVQIEQLVSLANGAKPLIIQLRDHLEWGLPPRSPIYPHGAAGLSTHSESEIQKTLYEI